MKLLPVSNPPNPWATTEREYLEPTPSRLELYEDRTQQILSRNDSPDIPFEWSVNPYRGCMHACAYCYARRYHEYLSFRAGTDFETKILFKARAAELLRRSFDKPSWKGDLVAFSGVTDCYQPLEASLRLTRACLEVCAEYRNPVGIITKAPLIERDLDVLVQLHREARVRVDLSIPFWDEEHARAIEPGVATPRRRLQALERLARAGLSVGVMVAPIIPGLSDEHLGPLLERARDAGAVRAGYVLLRLPGSVRDVFEERLRAQLPLRAQKVLHRVRETRGGALYDGRLEKRRKGDGNYAQALGAVFEAAVRRLGLSTEDEPEAPTTFRRPTRQLSLL